MKLRWAGLRRALDTFYSCGRTFPSPDNHRGTTPAGRPLLASVDLFFTPYKRCPAHQSQVSTADREGEVSNVVYNIPAV